MSAERRGVVTVTVNPALDHTLDCPGFTAGAVNRVASQTLTAGGKGVNVAAFLAARGRSLRNDPAAGTGGDGGAVAHEGGAGRPGARRAAPTNGITATGFLGRDNAAPFEELFSGLGIVDCCVRLPGASRVNVKVVDRPAQRVTDINLPGLAIETAALARLHAKIEALAAENHWFVLAGSVPAGVPDDIYADLVKRLHARGCFVAVDGSGGPLRHAVAALPDFIKPNQHELSELLGRPVEGREQVLAAARELRRSGIGLVVVSLGGEGAIFVDGERALLAVPPAIEVASTVGAGDALVAGILAARLEGGDLESCARLGTAFAAGKLAEVGPVLPPRARLETLMLAVQIESLGAA